MDKSCRCGHDAVSHTGRCSGGVDSGSGCSCWRFDECQHEEMVLNFDRWRGEYLVCRYCGQLAAGQDA